MSDRDQTPKAVRINSWGFETGTTDRGNRVPLFGVFLIVFGALLVAGQFLNVAQLGASALFLALGVILLAVWLRDRNDTALVVGLFVTAIGLSDLLTGAGVLHGEGWGTLFLGVGVLAVAPIRARQGKGVRWPLVIGALLCVWGGSDVATSYLKFDLGNLFVPILLVALGVWLVTRSRR
jgi:hypothetical protein